jgi:hypothetical protein
MLPIDLVIFSTTMFCSAYCLSKLLMLDQLSCSYLPFPHASSSRLLQLLFEGFHNPPLLSTAAGET